MMLPPRYRGAGARILDFDCESRPLSYLGSDFTTAEITAIAAAWADKPRKVTCWALGEVTIEEMLEGFLSMYRAADMVTGHNILRHDLPRLGGMLLEANLGPLPPIMVQDTYLHLKKRQGVSASQESLAEMLGIPAPKVHMSQPMWREANRLLPEGVIKTKARVIGDVKQHIALRTTLLELDWLNPPRRWTP